MTWDHDVTRDFWLLRDYVPAAAETDARLAVPISDLISLLEPDDVSTTTIPLPHDCTDGFEGSHSRRPHTYLEVTIQ